MTQALASDLPAGEHRVTYRVVSTDGHPVSGTMTFTTTAAPSPSPEPTASVTPTPSATASAAPTPAETPPSTEPASERRRRARPWVVGGLAVVAALVALVLGLARRSPHAPARTPWPPPADPADADRRRGRAPPDRGPGPLRLTDFVPDGGRLLISASRAISSIGRAADS